MNYSAGAGSAACVCLCIGRGRGGSREDKPVLFTVMDQFIHLKICIRK